MANNSTDPETKPGCLMFNVEDGEVESETLVSHIGVVIVGMGSSIIRKLT